MRLATQNPFSECGNTCIENQKLADGDTLCRDGGKGAFLPTLCEFSTACALCGFRTNSRAIEQDDSCAHANNGVCEDGGVGSSFVSETRFGYGGVTHLCGLGTDSYACDSIEQTPHADLDTTPAHNLPQPFWQDRLRHLRRAHVPGDWLRRLHGA